MKFKYKRTFSINSFSEETFEVIYDNVNEFSQVKESVKLMHETSKKMENSQEREYNKKRYDKNNPCRNCILYDDCFRLEKNNSQCEDFDNEPF